MLLDFPGHHTAVLLEVLVVSQDHEELLQQGGVVDGHANHVAPEAEAGAALDPLAPHHNREGADVGEGGQLGSRLPTRCSHLQVVGVHPIHVGIGLIQGAERVDVLVGDLFDRPGWHEVQQVGLVHALGGVFVLDQASFLLQACPKGRFRQGLEHAHHRGGDAGAGDEINDAIASAALFTIEANDETSHHAQAIGGDAINGCIKRIAGVLNFPRCFQAALIRGFDAEEDAFKAGVVHHLHHFLVVGQIDRGLGGEAEGIAALFLPLANFGQQQFRVALVADEVVVDQEDRTAPTQVVEVLQLSNELIGGFGAGFAAVENDDVAELAVERAAA